MEELDAAYEEGDRTGDYGIIDIAYDEAGYSEEERGQVIYEPSQEERDAAEDSEKPYVEIPKAYYKGERISPFYAPGCAEGLRLRDNAECDE